jgi:hypothetical protein
MVFGPEQRAWPTAASPPGAAADHERDLQGACPHRPAPARTAGPAEGDLDVVEAVGGAEELGQLRVGAYRVRRPAGSSTITSVTTP